MSVPTENIMGLWKCRKDPIDYYSFITLTFAQEDEDKTLSRLSLHLTNAKPERHQGL